MTSMLKVIVYANLDPFDAMNHRVVHCPIPHDQSAKTEQRKNKNRNKIVSLIITLGVHKYYHENMVITLQIISTIFATGCVRVSGYARNSYEMNFEIN